jgi:coproporphyrinogen III oxidase-like Fe-S oxidoreductase
MISDKLINTTVRVLSRHYTNIKLCRANFIPGAKGNNKLMLYVHIPFCESLCPYCSFNRYPFEEGKARSYFECLRSEMRMVKALGYDFDSMYIGGGTPTILPDELRSTILLAKELFSIREVSTETNPNHLNKEHLEPIRGLVDRMSVGVQSFDDGLLKRMCRFQKYGSGAEIAERINEVSSEGIFKTLNVDMIFNFPGQTEEMLLKDIKIIRSLGCNQTTFYPLMASPSVEAELKRTLGKVDYKRERRYYELICRELTDGIDADFEFGSVWTFNRINSKGRNMIDEYVVDHEEYPAIGAGGMAFLDRQLFVNVFSLEEYEQRIREGKMSLWGHVRFGKRDHMRYRLLMQLFGMSLDTRQWKRDFGVSPQKGLPLEFLILGKSGALLGSSKDDVLQLSKKGRYLLLMTMREFFIGVNTVRDKARGMGHESRQRHPQ